MEDISAFFSLLLFAAFGAYLLLGINTIHKNPQAGLNRAFFAICAALSLWSWGFSLATIAPGIEICKFWLRFSSLGWSTIYAIVLHYFLLLTGYGHIFRKRKAYSLYIPAVFSLYGFFISPGVIDNRFNFLMTDYGLVFLPQQGAWNMFFNVYYITYLLASLGLLWHWKQKSSDRIIRAQANLIFLSIVFATVLGSLTDGVLTSVLSSPLPNMAPVFSLIPAAAMLFSIKHQRPMGKASTPDSDQILDHKARAKLYYYLSVSFIAGGWLSFLSRFFSHMIEGEANLETTIITSLIFFALGFAILIIQNISSGKVRDILIISLALFSIPLITFRFLEFACITVWAFPLIIMMLALLFNSRWPLILLTATAIITQIIVWSLAPAKTIAMDEFDYIIRIGIFVIAFCLGITVNNIYLRRLQDNVFQRDFQKFISDISFDFVSANPLNINEKIDAILDKTCRFFRLDSAYVFLIKDNDNAISHRRESCKDEVEAGAGSLIEIPADSASWWMKQWQSNKQVYIGDVRKLPPTAGREKEFLIQKNIKSLAAIPLEDDGSILGFMVFDYIQLVKTRSDYHIELLKILSNLLADGLIRIKAQKEIGHMAYYDQLTGLPNRRLYADMLNKSIQLAKENACFIAVILLDLDDFKVVNDVMGHSGGDFLLKEVARNLIGGLREKDIAARFGGDEFLIMINNIKEAADISALADAIMGLFDKAFIINGQEFFVSGSAGVAVYPFDGGSAEALIKNADIAMYMAKAQGKNQYVLCTEAMKAEVQNNIMLSNKLYRVQEREELLLYYQPQINLNRGEIIGLEVLLRWKHPEIGMLSPNAFIPLAEANGTIKEIGDWVMQTACRQNKEWQDAGLPHLRIAVNLSFIQFNDPKLVEKIAAILKASGLRPEYLEVEITESMTMEETSPAIDILNKLKNLGISVSIDDFGTKYSSLNRLKKLPVDKLKIDRQFVQGIESSEKDRAIIKIIINLAKSLGLGVLAEGVETESQLLFLNRHSCDAVQGYYYYKPMPAKEIENLLRSFYRA